MWEFQVSTFEFWRDTSIQSVTLCDSLWPVGHCECEAVKSLISTCLPGILGSLCYEEAQCTSQLGLP